MTESRNHYELLFIILYESRNKHKIFLSNGTEVLSSISRCSSTIHEELYWCKRFISKFSDVVKEGAVMRRKHNFKSRINLFSHDDVIQVLMKNVFNDWINRNFDILL